MLYKVTLTSPSAHWRSYDIPIPDGHSARYIYVYLMETRSTHYDPYLDVKEIEAYAAFSFRKSSCNKKELRLRL